MECHKGFESCSDVQRVAQLVLFCILDIPTSSHQKNTQAFFSCPKKEARFQMVLAPYRSHRSSLRLHMGWNLFQRRQKNYTLALIK